MSKCLITQLKGNFNDDTLLKEGEFSITFQPETVNDVLLGVGNKPLSIWASQDIIYNDEVKPANTYFTTHDYCDLTASNTEPVTIKVSSKYTIDYIHLYGIAIDMKGFDYIHPTELFIEKGYTGSEMNFSDIFPTETRSLSVLREKGGNFKGTLADVEKAFREDGAEIFVRSIVGDIKDIVNLINLKTIDFSGVKGTIESFAEGQVAAGRTTGTVSGWPGNFITYKGVVWDNTKRMSIVYDSSYNKGYKVLCDGEEI